MENESSAYMKGYADGYEGRSNKADSYVGKAAEEYEQGYYDGDCEAEDEYEDDEYDPHLFGCDCWECRP